MLVDYSSYLLEYPFKKINPNKISFSFTWDDNFESHCSIIAPLFESYHKLCTFFVNPGEPDYQEYLGQKYAHLAKIGFEIGSHGYTHHHFSSLSQKVFCYQLEKSQKAIWDTTGVIPIVFAFPHHDFTTPMLKCAKEVYFETRNTLHNTSRFSFKTNTSHEKVESVIKNAINNKQSYVFSGHSVILDSNIQKDDGYEPLKFNLLKDTLNVISTFSEVSEICTLGQAALKEYICCNCNYSNTSFYISRTQLIYLEHFGLTSERIKEMV